MKELWKPGKIDSKLPEIAILRPAIPLRRGKNAQFTAVFNQAGDWKSLHMASGFKMEWHLVKNDMFGNAIAIKKIGDGCSVHLEIPENYSDYQLRLSIAKGDFSVATLTTLNTPLVH